MPHFQAQAQRLSQPPPLPIPCRLHPTPNSPEQGYMLVPTWAVRLFTWVLVVAMVAATAGLVMVTWLK